ncbi:MAG: hypothetical protein AAGF01_08310 [Cyanobacteria bacterium P01_G01_bin.38]
MPQLSMTLWLGLIQMALVPVTETVIPQTSVVNGSQTNNTSPLEQPHPGAARWTYNSTAA